MGGVDLLDRALSCLRPVIHGKKWYWPLFINLINIAFVYSWRLYCIVSGETIPQKDFRRHIVGIMIRQSKPCVISVDSRPTKAHKVADEMRYNELCHYPSAAQFRNVLFVGNVAEIHVRSANEAYMSKHVSRFFMKSDYTMTLLPQHVLCYLKMFCNCCHINRQRTLPITDVFLTCHLETIERNLS